MANNSMEPGLLSIAEAAFSTIDYQSRKITIGPIDPSMAAIPYEAHPGYALVEMRIKQRSLRLLVDTGASDLMLFEGATRDFWNATKTVSTKTWSNMGGGIRVKQVLLEDSYLGSMPWGTRDVFIFPDSGAIQVGEFRGLLGVASLKARRVAFDPEHRVFAWETKGGKAGTSRSGYSWHRGDAGAGMPPSRLQNENSGDWNRGVIRAGPDTYFLII